MEAGAPSSGARVFLTDFGLAKNVATGSKYTRTGETLGTPAYMSPELARGEVAALTPASDVWALGCVLYELLTNQRAFDGETAAAVIGRVLTTNPRHPPQAPARLRGLVAACLAKSPRRRPGHAAAVRDDCGRLLRGARPVARSPRNRTRITGVVVLAAAAAVILVIAVGRQAIYPDAAETSRATVIA